VRNPVRGAPTSFENRRTMARIFPELFQSQHIRPVANYAQRPATGPSSGCAAECRLRSDGRRAHGRVFITRRTSNTPSSLVRMGVELVEGRDLLARNNVVYMRDHRGRTARRRCLPPRRDDYSTLFTSCRSPLIGCAGIVNAGAGRQRHLHPRTRSATARRRTNCSYTYVPDLIRYYLNEEARFLKNVETMRPLEDPDQLE